MSITEKLEVEIAKAGSNHLRVVWDGFEVKDVFRAVQISGDIDHLKEIHNFLNIFTIEQDWTLSRRYFGGPANPSSTFSLSSRRTFWTDVEAQIGDWIVIDQDTREPSVVTRAKFAELKTVPYTSDLLAEMKSLMDFGKALHALKMGKRVTRKGWNASGMFVYYVPAASYPAQTGAAKEYFGESAMVPYEAYFALKNSRNKISTWVPSISDCLAEDWMLVQEQQA